MTRSRAWVLLVVAGFAWSCGSHEVASSRATNRSLFLLDKRPDAGSSPSERSAWEVRAVEIEGDERAAVWAPAPSTFTFTNVAIPGDCHLEFAVGVAGPATSNPRSDGVEFLVHVRAPGAETVRWSQVLDPAHRSDDVGWSDVAIDLGGLAGQQAQIEFEASPREYGFNDFSAWAEPRLVDCWTGEPPDPHPVDLWNVHTELAPGSVSQATLQVPPRSRLRIAGELARRGPLSDPIEAEFRVRLDDNLVDVQKVFTHGWREGFATEVDLADLEGQTITIELSSVLAPGVEKRAEASWLYGRVETKQEVPRLEKASGANVLVVVVDTLRADRLGLYGHSRSTSPNLDAFAEKGLIFERAISASSWTMPATASLFTGLTAPEHRVADGYPLAASFESLAERMQQRGFTTIGISANSVVGRMEGFDQGFERFLQLPWARAETISRVLVEFLREYQEERWFAYVHYTDPHDPYQPPAGFEPSFDPESTFEPVDPPSFNRMVRAVNFGEGDDLGVESRIEDLLTAYDTEISYWDHSFGQLISTLETMKVMDDTVVVVTSDHGEEFLEHDRLKHGLQLFEESIRVPWVVWYPEQIDPYRHPEVVETRRVGSLLEALLGPDRVGSRELVRLATHPDRVALTHTTHAINPSGRGRIELGAVRGDRWKVIAAPAFDSLVYLDLVDDPGEVRPVSDDLPAVVRDHSARLETWLEQAAEEPDRTAPQEQILEELRALGYVQ